MSDGRLVVIHKHEIIEPVAKSLAVPVATFRERNVGLERCIHDYADDM